MPEKDFKEDKIVVLGLDGVGKSNFVIQLICNHFAEEYDPTIVDSYRKQCTVDDAICLMDVLDTAMLDPLQGNLQLMQDDAMVNQYMHTGNVQIALEIVWEIVWEIQWKPIALEIVEDCDNALNSVTDCYMKAIEPPIHFKRNPNFLSADGFLLVYSVTNRTSFDAIPAFVELIRKVRQQYTFPMVLVGNQIDRKNERVVNTDEGLAMAATLGNVPFFEASCKDRINCEEVFFELVRENRKARGWVPPPTWKDKFLNMIGLERGAKPVPPKPRAPIISVPPSTLLQDMISIFRNRSEFADMEIHVLDNKMPANRIICCARSKFLRDLIMADSGQLPCIIQLTDIPLEVLLLVLEYIYTSTIESIQKLSEDQLNQVCHVAQKFELKELMQLCTSIIKGEGIAEVVANCTTALEHQIKLCFTRSNKYSAHTSDISFQVQPSVLKAHKVILSSRSIYFRTLFRNKMIEAKTNEVIIEDIDADAFETMLRFIYTSDPQYVTPSNASSLLQLAHRYAIPRLLEVCELLLSQGIDESNVYTVFELAEQFHASQLLNACTYFIVVEFDTIYQKFPVLKELHKRIKPQIKKNPEWVAYLKYQSKYWNSHAAIYQPSPQDGGWKRLLSKKDKKPKEDEEDKYADREDD